MTCTCEPKKIKRKPKWLIRNLPTGPEYERIRKEINQSGLHTVCQEAKCPNMWECYSEKTATFLIMGPNCTRRCRFCAVQKNSPEPLNDQEPGKVADAAFRMGLKYVVITSVTRDDLDDGGAVFFSKTINAVKSKIPDAKIEVLIPDFQGNKAALNKVINAKPDVINHNVETVSRLYLTVRPQADYKQSLELLQYVASSDSDIVVKSGIMLGLGETDEEIRETLTDLYSSGCRFLTMGQYLQPSKNHLPVEQFITPEAFKDWEKFALKIGFSKVAGGPFVRSSYHAGAMLKV
ncbi:MAG: lipoyl synthase [Desulfobacterales bacterium]|nr:lipoyl synthase [Desulfobacterales bacterium]